MMHLTAADGSDRLYSFAFDVDDYNTRFWDINRTFIRALCNSSPFNVEFDDNVFAQEAVFTSTVNPDIWFKLKLLNLIAY